MCFDVVRQGDSPGPQCKGINTRDFFLCNIMVHLGFLGINVVGVADALECVLEYSVKSVIKGTVCLKWWCVFRLSFVLPDFTKS